MRALVAGASGGLKRLAALLLAAAGFAALALALTDPLRTVLSECWAGAGELEEWIWNYWYFKKLIAAHFASHSHPWLSVGSLLVTLTSSFTDIGNYLDLLALSIPLEARLGAPLYYNVKILVILVLNGVGAFLLCRHLAGDSWVAFLGGAVFTFNSYVVEMIDEARVREALIAPIPLFVLYLLKSIDEGGVRSSVLAGLFLGLAAAVYWFYGIFLLYLFVILVAFRLAARSLTKRFLGSLAVMALTALAVVLPFGMSYLEPFVTKTFQPHRKLFIPPNHMPSYRQIVTETPGVVDYNINNFRVMLKDSRGWDYPFARGSHHRVFPLLILFALALFWRRESWPWLAAVFLFHTLALGPFLKGGFPEAFCLSPSGDPWKMPYQLAYTWTPVLPRLFHPNRALAFVFLGLSVLLCINWSYLRARLRIPAALHIALLVLVTAGLAWHLRQEEQFPPVLTRLEIPTFYRDLAESRGGDLVEAPWEPSKNNDYMLYQTVHGRRILWGSAYAGELDQNRSAFVQYMKGLNELKAGAFRSEDLDEVKALGFSTLLLHEISCYRVAGPRGGELFRFMETQLQRRFGKPKAEFLERPRLLPGDYHERSGWGRVLRFAL